MTTVQMILIVVGVIFTGSVSWVLGAAWCGHFTRLAYMERKCIWEEIPGDYPGVPIGAFKTGCGHEYFIAGHAPYNMRFCPWCGAMTVPRSIEIRRKLDAINTDK